MVPKRWPTRGIAHTLAVFDGWGLENSDQAVHKLSNAIGKRRSMRASGGQVKPGLNWQDTRIGWVKNRGDRAY